MVTTVLKVFYILTSNAMDPGVQCHGMKVHREGYL